MNPQILKLSIGLNEQFYSTGNQSLGPNEQFSIPLEAFIARNGSTRFPIGREIKLVTVFAQLNRGTRAVSEIHLTDPSAKQTDWLRSDP
jgi:hypothetical protein